MGRINKKALRIGDYICCHDEEDLKQLLKDLGDEGYGAVRAAPYSAYWIVITSKPGQVR